MTPIRMFAFALALSLSGCLGGSAPHSRYFAPLVELPPAQPAGEPLLRDRGLNAPPHLKDRIVWRLSDVEVGVYDLRRWLAAPPQMVSTALTRELFQGRGLRRTMAGSAPALEVELELFEEELAPGHLARIQLSALLVNREQEALLDKTYRVERAIADEEPESMARAMGQALAELSGQVADDVLQAMAQPAKQDDGE